MFEWSPRSSVTSTGCTHARCIRSISWQYMDLSMAGAMCSPRYGAWPCPLSLPTTLSPQTSLCTRHRQYLKVIGCRGESFASQTLQTTNNSKIKLKHNLCNHYMWLSKQTTLSHPKRVTITLNSQ